MAKYKVGDKVIVRKDLDEDEQYWMDDKSDYWYPEEEMVALGGKTVTIEAIKESYYLAEETKSDSFWTDTMFVGLQGGTTIPKFNVGDKVKVVRTDVDSKKKFIGTVYTIRELNPNGPKGYSDPHYGVKDPDCMYIWRESELELVTDNLYENACWYCRKGGLVDLYLAGVMGICPSCGRVCNNTHPTPKKESIVIEFKPKENKPLTTEELKALPNGTKVFTVWLNERSKEPSQHDTRTCWRTVNHSECQLDRKSGQVSIGNNGRLYHAYLEIPEGYVDNDP